MENVFSTIYNPATLIGGSVNKSGLYKPLL